MSRDKLNIVLLAGGTSPEREVSKMSSKAIFEALQRLGHNVSVVDPGFGASQPENPNRFFVESEDYAKPDHGKIPEALNLPVFGNADLVFIGLHGIWGEDGKIQSLLEMKGLKYTGSGVLASAAGMDKHVSKVLFQFSGVPTPKWMILRDKNDIPEASAIAEKSFGFPMIVKPNDQGSTVGLALCPKSEDFINAVETAFDYSDSVMVEEFIPGRELTVGVLNGRPLPPLEIVPKHELYDYECKYSDGMSDYIVPAEIDEVAADRMRYSAVEAFNALNCKTYARVDFRLKSDNSFFCLEVNTLPGMTSHSLLPMMAEADGLNFDRLIEQIVNSSVSC